MSLNGHQTHGSHKWEARNNHRCVRDQLVPAVKIRTCSVTQLSPGQWPIYGLVMKNSSFITDTLTLSLTCRRGQFYKATVSIQYDPRFPGNISYM